MGFLPGSNRLVCSFLQFELIDDFFAPRGSKKLIFFQQLVPQVISWTTM